MIAVASFSAGSKPFAIVTGGTRGIGSGIATVLCEEGYNLLLTYNSDKDSADDFAESLTDQHDDLQVECVGGDITLCSTRDEIFKAVDKMRDDGGRLGVVVHNAGQYIGVTSTNSEGIESRPLTFGDGSLVDADGSTNFKTMHYYQKMYGEAWVDLLERSLVRMDGPGTIVGVSSPGVSAVYYGPDPSYSMPGAGKCLMEYSTRVYALKAAERGINVNVVIPGATFTDAWRRLAGKLGLESETQMIDGLVSTRVPMKKRTTPADIGDMVKFLCTRAGRFVTGTVIPMDGGLHMRW